MPYHACESALTRPYSVKTRSFAAVIFRRIASKTRRNAQGETVDMFLALSDDQVNVIRQKVLESLVSESERAVRNKISDAVAELARQFTDNGEFWLSRRHSCTTWSYPLVGKPDAHA